MTVEGDGPNFHGLEIDKCWDRPFIFLSKVEMRFFF